MKTTIHAPSPEDKAILEQFGPLPRGNRNRNHFFRSREASRLKGRSDVALRNPFANHLFSG